jgi:hypothetical protein
MAFLGAGKMLPGFYRTGYFLLMLSLMTRWLMVKRMFGRKALPL